MACCLYQYAGIVICICGLLSALLGHFMTILCFLNSQEPTRKMYSALTFREIDYLEYIRRKDMPIYGELLRKLKDSRLRETYEKKNKYDYLNQETF